MTTEGNQLQQTKPPQLDYILLDGSASMRSKWDDVCSAIDSYISGLQAERVNSHIYLHVFSSNSTVDLVGYEGPISEWQPIRGRLRIPYEGTDLYDAVGIMARRMRDFDPTCGRITIVTDGEEGGSHMTNLVQAKAFLDWMRAKGWPITFIGADFSNYQQAAQLGADKSNTVGVAQARLKDATSNLAKKAAAHSRGAEDINFTSSEQEQFGGYLAPPRS